MSDALADPLTAPVVDEEATAEDETKLQGDNPSQDEVIGREGSEETPEVETAGPIEPPDIVPDDEPPAPPAAEEPGPEPAAEEPTIVGPSDGLSEEEQAALEESNAEAERLELADIQKDQARAAEEAAEAEADQPEPALEPPAPAAEPEEEPVEEPEEEPEAEAPTPPDPPEKPVAKPSNSKNRLYLVFEETKRSGKASYSLVPECLHPSGQGECGQIESRNGDNALRAAYRRLVELRKDPELVITLDIRTAGGFRPRRVKPRVRNLPPALEID